MDTDRSFPQQVLPLYDLLSCSHSQRLLMVTLYFSDFKKSFTSDGTISLGKNHPMSVGLLQN